MRSIETLQKLRAEKDFLLVDFQSLFVKGHARDSHVINTEAL